MKRTLLIGLFFMAFVRFSFSQTPIMHSQKTTRYLEENPAGRKVETLSYFDELGRPEQEIILGGSPLHQDIVQVYEYDKFGRVQKQRLPYVKNTEGGRFSTNALAEQENWYQSAPGIAHSNRPYSETKYDNSPLNRVVSRSLPGEDIENSLVHSDYEIVGNLPCWRVDESSGELFRNGTYPANSLLKFSQSDPDGKITAVYKDKSGRVLLEENETAGLKTRYVYDKYGDLRYVLPPEWNRLHSSGVYGPEHESIKKYAYYYAYNERHLLITKQLPGKEAVYMKYDNSDRLRAVQDGKMRLEDKWLITNYDRLGRVYESGIGELRDPNEIINATDTLEPIAEKGTSAYLSYNYYDNYNFVDKVESGLDIHFVPALSYCKEKSSRIRGLATGSKTRVISSEKRELWLYAAVYYDDKGRTIQTVSQNHLGGVDIVSFEYNFAGEVLRKKQVHRKNPQMAPKCLTYIYSYDKMGRLLKTEFSQYQNEEDKVVLQKYEYDATGKMRVKRTHTEDGKEYLQSTHYDYDIKGALTKINDPDSLSSEQLFGMKLYYDTELNGNTTYKDGKISAIEWSSTRLKEVKSYTFEYDAANRLTKAIYAPENRYNVELSYDMNGNIKGLKRYGQALEKEPMGLYNPPQETIKYKPIDNLTYSYDGNQLISVTERVENIHTELNNDFRAGDVEFPQQYQYDANGNMIKDRNKGIRNIYYNHINQPEAVQMSGGKRIEYSYTAGGAKLRTKVFRENKMVEQTDYCGDYVYINNRLRYINIPEGRIAFTMENGTATGKRYEYYLTDHLGNVRVSYTKGSNGKALVIQEDHYYPFGMRMNGLHYTDIRLLDAVANKYLYNGKELQDHTGYYDYGFRQLDPALGRWFVQDALAEKYKSVSAYAYTLNDPINHTDLLGLLPNTTFHWWEGSLAQDGHLVGGGGNLAAFLNSGPSMNEVGPTGEDYDEFILMGGGDGSSFSEWYSEREKGISGFYTYLDGNIIRLYLYGIGSFSFKDGVPIARIFDNGNTGSLGC